MKAYIFAGRYRLSRQPPNHHFSRHLTKLQMWHMNRGETSVQHRGNGQVSPTGDPDIAGNIQPFSVAELQPTKRHRVILVEYALNPAAGCQKLLCAIESGIKAGRVVQAKLLSDLPAAVLDSLGEPVQTGRRGICGIV